MMKKICILLFSGLVIMTNAQNMLSYRHLMHKAVESETACKTLAENSKKAFTDTQKPIYEAFYAIGNLLMAKHTGNPISQFSYFKKGRTALDNAAKKDPQNLEIRFLRYMTQEKAPAFLGYNKDLKTDRTFILNEYKKSDDEDLIQRIKRHFKIS